MAWYFLTEEQVALLQQVLDQYRGQRVNPAVPRLAAQDALHQAPEVYVARTPADGIPANDLSGSPDEPGSAVCDIYRVWEGYLGTAASADLRDMSFSRLVYNIGGSTIQGDQYILIHRTKYGVWVAGGSASGLVIFGKMDENLTQGSSGTASVWEFNGSTWSDSTENTTVYDWLLQTGQDVASGKKIVAAYFGPYPIVIAAECP